MTKMEGRIGALMRLLLTLTALACVAAPTASAVGAGSGSSSSGGRATSPGQRAIHEYESGEKRLEQARQLRQRAVDARAEGDHKKVTKLEKKAEQSLARAEKHYRKAIEYDENLHQAWSSLGYTLRRQGEWAEALVAYDYALELEPRYAEAVEYRAEAYLELGRLEDAKQGYDQLVPWVRPYADRLLAKMETWVEVQRAGSTDVAPADIDAFAAWIDDRKARDGEGETFTPRERASW